jgi:DNA-binding response OmpR family regulator
MEKKILIIEDEIEISKIVKKYLEKEGYEVFTAENGFSGLKAFVKENPHLVILDLMMPGIDGFTVLEEIRKSSQVPVIILTARTEEMDRIKGFDKGVDDYVSKPFSTRELVARVRAILKRSYRDDDKDNLIKCGIFIMDMDKKTLYKNGREIILTSMEFNLMNIFMNNPGKVFTREGLIESAFSNYDAYDRGIDSHIKKIRQKIEEDTKKPKYIKTKYGAGYIFGGDNLDH